MNKREFLTLLPLAALVGIIGLGFQTGVINWSQINSLTRNGTGTYGQSSDGTGTSGHLAKYNSGIAVTNGPGLQGTDTNVLTAGTVSGTSVFLCTDANGGATTSSCPGSSNNHVCTIDNDTQSATALIRAQFSGGCLVPNNATIVEVDLLGGTGVIGGTGGSAITVTGTGTMNFEKYTPHTGAVTTILVNSVPAATDLAMVSGQACALTSFSGTCSNANTSSSTVKIGTTSISAGDWLRANSATPDTVQTWVRMAIIYTY